MKLLLLCHVHKCTQDPFQFGDAGTLLLCGSQGYLMDTKFHKFPATTCM